MKATVQRRGAFQARVLRWHEQGPRCRMNWTRVGYKEASILSRAENGYVEQGKDTRVCGSKPMQEGLKKPTEKSGLSTKGTVKHQGSPGRQGGEQSWAQLCHFLTQRLWKLIKLRDVLLLSWAQVGGRS